ncbi:MAG: quinol:electron acceptor oxidoreductase subunit ActD [Terriglobia bacterium]
MAGRNTAVFGIYSTYEGVQSGANALATAGFRPTDVAALVPENEGSKDLAHEKHNKGPDVAFIGAIVGFIVGGVLAWLLVSGIIAIKGTEPLTMANPVVAVLAGIGALGALGFIIGGLVGMSAPEYEARRYRGRLKKGGLLLSVHCDNSQWVKQARQALKTTGADSISEASEAGADYAVTDKPLSRTATGGSPEL